MEYTPQIDIDDNTDYLPFNKAAYMKAYEAKRAPRKAATKEERDARYLSRRIVAVDGEGLNVRRGPRKGQHDYVMLALSGVKPLINTHGIPTIDCLEYLVDNLDPDDLNVIYGGSYDFNCWLRDLMRDELDALYHSDYDGKPFMYRGYGLRWMLGKSFTITKYAPLGQASKTVTINDVISFFQRPFIAACDEYLGEYEGRDILVREKAKRGDFKASELKGIGAYNNLELELLVKLVEELRLRLFKVGLRPRRWNSPGAIAAALFERENVKAHRNENIPAPVASAARYAYAGGRFEMIKYGAMNEPAYEYDINSAYPRALTEVPSLQGGEWVYWKRGMGEMPESEFALYHCVFKNDHAPDMNIPAPMFHRGENGNISYPSWVSNWIWSPEYDALKEYCEVIEHATYYCQEAWLYIPATDHKPFGFIHALYKMRQALKKAKDGAHVGIKLALNSLYGKTAQQVGFRPAKNGKPVKIPTYHQLEWAGYVTSWCRAHVLRAALRNPGAVIAFETDALFTSEPLDLDIGPGLGQWEETKFENLTYVQSGHYYGTKIEDDGTRTEVVKCRGIDKGNVTREDVENALERPLWERTIDAPLTRFYGAGIALARNDFELWRTWRTETKTLRLFPMSKREHGACWCEGSEFENNARGVAWHNTYCPIFGTPSHEYPVAWINPNPAMTELEEARNGENFTLDEWD